MRKPDNKLLAILINLIPIIAMVAAIPLFVNDYVKVSP